MGTVFDIHRKYLQGICCEEDKYSLRRLPHTHSLFFPTPRLLIYYFAHTIHKLAWQNPLKRKEGRSKLKVGLCYAASLLSAAWGKAPSSISQARTTVPIETVVKPPDFISPMKSSEMNTHFVLCERHPKSERERQEREMYRLGEERGVNGKIIANWCLYKSMGRQFRN